METEKVKFKVEFEPNGYANNPAYSLEHEQDKRYYAQNHFWNISTLGEQSLKVLNDYENSYLKRLKQRVEKGEYDYFGKILKDNSMVVDVTVIKNNKVKTQFKEVKLSDKLVSVLKSYETLKSYQGHLAKYKQLRDEGKKQFFILDYGKEYSTDQEFRNIKMLLETTENAIKVMKIDGLENPAVNNWLKFLSENVKISTHHFEYGIVVREIESLPEFNRLQLDQINQTNQSFLKKLEIAKQKSADKGLEM